MTIKVQHINYVKEKMNVQLIVQTFYSSVTDANEYSMNDLK